MCFSPEHKCRLHHHHIICYSCGLRFIKGHNGLITIYSHQHHGAAWAVLSASWTQACLGFVCKTHLGRKDSGGGRVKAWPGLARGLGVGCGCVCRGSGRGWSVGEGAAGLCVLRTPPPQTGFCRRKSVPTEPGAGTFLLRGARAGRAAALSTPTRAPRQPAGLSWVPFSLLFQGSFIKGRGDKGGETGLLSS